MSLVPFEGNRGKDMREVLENALAHVEDYDGVVILMQKKKGGVHWFAPDNMHLQTMIFYLWSVLSQFGLMAAGKL
jgi:hypothetical protein